MQLCGYINIKTNFWTKDNFPETSFEKQECSENLFISKISQTLRGKTLQKKTSLSVGPCCSWQAPTVPKSCRTDEGNYKWERLILKAGSAFKVRANNLKVMVRPLYSENFLQQSSKRHSSQTEHKKGQGLKELEQASLPAPAAHPARTQLTPGSRVGQRHARATHHIHRNTSRSHAAGSSHLLGQRGLAAGVPSTHNRSWASEGRVPFGVTYGMWARLNSSCLAAHSCHHACTCWMPVLQQLHWHTLHPSPLLKGEEGGTKQQGGRHFLSCSQLSLKA